MPGKGFPYWMWECELASVLLAMWSEITHVCCLSTHIRLALFDTWVEDILELQPRRS